MPNKRKTKHLKSQQNKSVQDQLFHHVENALRKGLKIINIGYWNRGRKELEAFFHSDFGHLSVNIQKNGDGFTAQLAATA